MLQIFHISNNNSNRPNNQSQKYQILFGKFISVIDASPQPLFAVAVAEMLHKKRHDGSA